MPAMTNQRGFTLLELLIAMTLLGLLMLGLFGGLRLGARVWEAGEAQSADRTRIEAVQRFIRTYLSQARPLAAADRTGDDLVAFVGRERELDFAAALPSHLSIGGFAHVSLALADGDDGSALVVRRMPLRRREDGRAELFDIDQAEPPAVLLDGVESVAFDYYGLRDRREDPEWTDRWDDQTRLPLLVRMRILFPDADRRTWPPLTVALMVQDPPAVGTSLESDQ